jgi:(p)ppGpp synthase/HD superfamily hydrolase
MIKKAFLYAYEKHGNGTRKGSSIPYIVHPVDVASTLLKERNNSKVSDELIAAGLLHDVFEDTETSLEEIEKEFGKKVMVLVKAASEPEEFKGGTKEERRNTWKPRKTHTIEFMKTADRDSKLLSCADKLSNIRDMSSDRLVDEEALWKKFNAPPEEIKWYYQSMLEGFRTGNSIEDTGIFKVFEKEVKEFFGEQ